MPTQIFETVKQIIDVPNNFSGQAINTSGVGEGWSGGAAKNSEWARSDAEYGIGDTVGSGQVLTLL